MQGHTNKATINQRRPLTDNMKRVLGKLAKGPIAHVDLSQSSQNAARALCDRGYAAWVMEGHAYVITEEGGLALRIQERDNG